MAEGIRGQGKSGEGRPRGRDTAERTDWKGTEV